MSGTTPDLYAMPLRERIRWLRLHGRHGKRSHDQIAAALGTTRQTVIGWEKGSRPKPNYVTALAEYYDQPEDLFRAPVEEAVTLTRLADRLEELVAALDELKPLLGRVGDLQEQLDDLERLVAAGGPRSQRGKSRGGSGGGSQ